MRLRQVLPELLVIGLIVIGGALYDHLQKASAASAGEDTKQTLSDLQQAVKDLQFARQHEEGQISDLQRQLSAEQEQRKSLSDQINGLAERMDGLQKAHAESTRPTRRERGRR